ncbi:dTDP-4-dehydrorhamnose 3,5-epimerase [bacterium]|nr:dTDP-4-dehydrorhamnose 3,5-epimerase [bacterium]
MFQRLDIPEVFVVTPRRFSDSRGYFCETFKKSVFEPITGSLDWVQENHSRSEPRHTVRGLHFQIPPFAQDKLVRCVRGRVLDVAVDIRRGSPTFGRHVSVVLTEAQGEQIFIPKGFAHGFATLEEGCEVVYRLTNEYSPAHERGLLWNDPALAIDWGVPAGAATLSPKDAAAPRLSELVDAFGYDG